MFALIFWLYKITLPDGGWASLRDPKKVPERLRRPLVTLQRRMLGTDMAKAFEGVDDVKSLDESKALDLLRPIIASEDYGMLDDINDLLIVALVEEWSFDLPITVEGSLDLPGDARDALIAACQPLVGPLTGQVEEADITDPTSPTGAVNG